MSCPEAKPSMPDISVRLPSTRTPCMAKEGHFEDLNAISPGGGVTDLPTGRLFHRIGAVRRVARFGLFEANKNYIWPFLKIDWLRNF